MQPRPEASAFPFEQLDEEKPLVYISPDMMVTDQAFFFRLCMRAFAQSHWQVVMVVGKSVAPEVLRNIPANFPVQPFVSQLEFLQRASLFVTHGGMNSVNEALAYHVPLVIVPQGADQHLIARRAAKPGAGKQPSFSGFRVHVRLAWPGVITHVFLAPARCMKANQPTLSFSPCKMSRSHSNWLNSLPDRFSCTLGHISAAVVLTPFKGDH